MDGYLLTLTAIRSLNDELRTRLRGGTILVSEEVKELGPVVHAHALVTMAQTYRFEDEEHQYGNFFFCARLFQWSIDYSGSSDPANPKVTSRVLNLTL